MRIDYNILKTIEEWYGSDDFEVGSDVTFDLLSDDKFVEPYITLRFGYWSQIQFEELAQLLPFRYELIENEVDDDEFGHPLYNYLIKSK
tara:strand:- start:194 stop:460 length:267 start_codon:yes stop_codon:yes gene_type:complete